MEKSKVSTYILFISIFTFIALFFFMVQKSYDNLMKPVDTVKKSDLLKPVDPVLDTTVLDEIEKRQFYLEDETFPTSTESAIIP